MDFAMSAKAQDYHHRLTEFMVEHVLPAEAAYDAYREEKGPKDFTVPPVVEELKEKFGDGVLPLGVPIVTDGRLAQIVDLVLGEVHDYSAGPGTRTVAPTGEEHIGLFEAYHGPLLEGIITEAEDDTLLERYLGDRAAIIATHAAPLLGSVVTQVLHLDGSPSPHARTVR